MTPGAALAALIGLWSLYLSFCLAAGWAREPGAPEGPEWMPRAYLPDVNTAPHGHLMLLPRIGPSRARAIERERANGGPFVVLDDLQRVHGIGPYTISALRGLARVNPVSEGDP